MWGGRTCYYLINHFHCAIPTLRPQVNWQRQVFRPLQKGPTSHGGGQVKMFQREGATEEKDLLLDPASQ